MNQSVNQQVTGMDRRNGRILIAETEVGGGRPKVLSLHDWSADMVDSAGDTHSSQVVISVPDDEVLLKHLRKPAGSAGSERDRLAFELVQSLLEGEDQFVFDFLPLSGHNAWLGFVFRRQRLQELLKSYGKPRVSIPAESVPEELPFVSRSRALGQGYLAFCEQDDGEVIGLADVSEKSVAICLLHNRRIVDLAHLTLRRGDQPTERFNEQLSVDLRMVVNFRLSGLANLGISAPLSRMILLGDGVDDNLRQTAEKYFPVGVTAPRLQRGYFAESAVSDPATAVNYLIALGLTVN